MKAEGDTTLNGHSFYVMMLDDDGNIQEVCPATPQYSICSSESLDCPTTPQYVLDWTTVDGMDYTGCATCLASDPYAMVLTNVTPLRLGNAVAPHARAESEVLINSEHLAASNLLTLYRDYAHRHPTTTQLDNPFREDMHKAELAAAGDAGWTCPKCSIYRPRIIKRGTYPNDRLITECCQSLTVRITP